ncbi:MAG: hypothetical protein ACLVHV_01335 [Oscillospiraceae bacterium]
MALEGLAGRLSCLGCALLYSTLAIGCSGTDAFAQAVKEAWRRLQETGFRVNGIDGFSLSLEAAQEGEPLSLAGGAGEAAGAASLSNAAAGGIYRF